MKVAQTVPYNINVESLISDQYSRFFGPLLSGCHADAPLINMHEGQLEQRSWPHSMPRWRP